MTLPIPGPTVPPIIGITAPAGHGKSTLAGYLADAGCARRSFAGGLKQAAAAFFGCDPAHYYGSQSDKARPLPFWGDVLTRGTGRGVLQDLGMAMREAFGPDIHILHLLGCIQQSCGGLVNVPAIVIDDLRLPNEAEWIRRSGGLVVHLRRVAGTTDPAAGADHPTELGLDRAPGDLLVTAATLDHLRRLADHILRRLEQTASCQPN